MDQPTLEETTGENSPSPEWLQKEKLAVLGSLVAGVAHEINTPLGICVTSSSVLGNELSKIHRKYQNQEMTQEDFETFLGVQTETLRLLEINLTRAHELVSSFKRFSVDQSSEIRRPFSIREQVEDILASLGHELRMRAVACALTFKGPEHLVGVPGLLHQILLNLMMNSLIHGFETIIGGRITLRVQVKKKALKLDYSDNGLGMDEKILARLYEPFFTSKPGRGSGLGMSLIYSIVVHRLGGTIQAKSASGKGVRFLLEIPFSPAEFQVVPEPEPPA